MKYISKYIQGKLTKEQALNLWLHLLQYPKWIKYLEIEIALKEIYDSEAIKETTDEIKKNIFSE